MIAPGSQLPSVDRPERVVVLVEQLRDRLDDRDLPRDRPVADEVDVGRDRAGLAVVALPEASSESDDLRSVAETQREAADVVAQGLEALADGHVTRSEGARLERECDEALAALLAIRELARRAQVEGVIPMTRRGAA